MANHSYVVGKNSIDYPSFLEKMKEINKDFFLGYFEVIEDNNAIIISEPNTEKLKEPESFVMFINDGYFTEGEDAKISGFSNNCIESPHSQYSSFFWYVKSVFECELSKWLNTRWFYDEGVGWYDISERNSYHCSYNTYEDKKDFFSNLNECYNKRRVFGMCNLSKQTKKFFKLASKFYFKVKERIKKMLRGI